MRGQTRAFGAERLLGDLYDDLLAFLQQLFDFRLRPAVAPPSAPVAASRATGAVLFLFILRVELVELFDRVDDVRHVEKAVAFEADINERALHAGEYFGYSALVDI